MAELHTFNRCTVSSQDGQVSGGHGVMVKKVKKDFFTSGEAAQMQNKSLLNAIPTKKEVSQFNKSISFIEVSF